MLGAQAAAQRSELTRRTGLANRMDGLDQPIAQHPENPHVFLWKGRAKAFVASGEHYGALINRQFDYRTYLRTLQSVGLGHTREFLGDYLEGPDAFGGILTGINTLEPAWGQFICPWARSDKPGFARGGNKFDLDRWDSEYFDRVHNFFDQAGQHGVTIEAMLFFVGPSWALMPLNPDNNVNRTEQVAEDGYLVARPGSRMQQYQERYVRRMVRELNGYNHFVWNVSNEPWLNNAKQLDNKKPAWSGIEMQNGTKAFVKMVARWITEEESSLPKRHLIGVDITNEGHLVRDPDLATYYKDLQILNVHYDTNARSLELNYGRTDKILTYNETGLTKTKMAPSYRTDGWYYLMSGGGLYNNLDYTFHHDGAEDGTFDPVFPSWYKGCGDPRIKKHLAVLQDFRIVRKNRGLIRALAVCQGSDIERVRGRGRCGIRRIFSW